MTIEQIIYDYLKAHNVECFLEKPDVTPDSYVLIDKTGGSERNKLPSGMVIIQSIAPSRYEAATFADAVHELIMEIIELPSIGGISLNSGPYNFSDLTKKLNRYQAVYDIAYYR